MTPIRGVILALEDRELLLLFTEVSARIPHTLSAWERDFISSVNERFAARGTIFSWRQRKVARDVLTRVFELLCEIHDVTPTTPVRRQPPARQVVAARAEPAPPRLVLLKPRKKQLIVSRAQVRTLALLDDGEWHRTANIPGDDCVSGSCAHALVRRSVLLSKRVDRATYVMLPFAGRMQLHTALAEDPSDQAILHAIAYRKPETGT